MDQGGGGPVTAEATAAPAHAAGASSDRAAGGFLLAVFSAATFLGAGLVFLVQPMVAKMLLPLLGGSPMVWNTSMVFFQAALLAGYWYAHRTTAALGLRRQPWVHLVVLILPLLVLPIALPAGWAPPTRVTPTLWLLLVLLIAVGAPYFAVTTASPLLQRWFAATTHEQAHDPYFLYAAGNAGSLLGLLAYPLLLEPRLTLAGQARLWAAGYVGFVVLAAACVLLLRRYRAPATTAVEVDGGSDAVAVGHSPAPDWRARLRWVAFAFVPSSLMLGVTQFLSTDIASVPLLWVLPLSIYLLTFILAFARLSDLWVRLATAVLPFVVVAVAVTFLDVVYLPTGVVFALHLVALFVVGLLGHGRLAQERPAPQHLTMFFLLLSIGGVLGGLFNALVAPGLFDRVLEYPLVIVASLLLLRGRERRGLLPARHRWVEDLALFVILFRLVVQLLSDYQVWGGVIGAVGLVLVVALAMIATRLLSAQPLMFTVAVAAMFSLAVLSTGPLPQDGVVPPAQ